VPARRFSGTRHLLYPFPGTTHVISNFLLQYIFVLFCSCLSYAVIHVVPVYKISAAGAKVFYLLVMIVTSFSGDNIDAAVDYRIK